MLYSKQSPGRDPAVAELKNVEVRYQRLIVVPSSDHRPYHSKGWAAPADCCRAKAQ